MPPLARPDPDAQRFGALVTSLRKQRGWTIRKLAQRLGVTPQWLGVLEAGRNLPTLKTILEIADVFDVDAGDLVREVAKGRRPRHVEIPKIEDEPATPPAEP